MVRRYRRRELVGGENGDLALGQAGAARDVQTHRAIRSGSSCSVVLQEQTERVRRPVLPAGWLPRRGARPRPMVCG